MFSVVAAAGAAPTVATYIGSNGNTANQTSYSFAGQSVGSAVADRRIIVGVKTQAAALTGVTYGGAAMTLLGSQTAGSDFLSFWEIDEDVSTSGTFVFSGGSMSNIRFSVWSVVGGTKLAFNDQQTAASSASQSVSATLTCPGSTAVLAVATMSDSSNVTSNAWTNATERDDATPEGTTQRYGAADAAVASPGSLALTCTMTSGGGIRACRILGICL